MQRKRVWIKGRSSWGCTECLWVFSATRVALCLALLHPSLWASGDSPAVPKLEQVLPRVQEHVREFELLLPDFICDETITSRELMGGVIQHETVIDSSFRGTQHK